MGGNGQMGENGKIDKWEEMNRWEKMDQYRQILTKESTTETKLIYFWTMSQKRLTFKTENQLN